MKWILRPGSSWARMREDPSTINEWRKDPQITPKTWLSKRINDSFGEKMARPILSSNVSGHLHHQLVQHISRALPNRQGLQRRPPISRDSNSLVSSGSWDLPDSCRYCFFSLGSKEHFPTRHARSLTLRRRRGIVTQLSGLDHFPILTRGRSSSILCTSHRHPNTPLQTRGRRTRTRTLQRMFQHRRRFRPVCLGDRYRRSQLARRADTWRRTRLDLSCNRTDRNTSG